MKRAIKKVMNNYFKSYPRPYIKQKGDLKKRLQEHLQKLALQFTFLKSFS